MTRIWRWKVSDLDFKPVPFDLGSCHATPGVMAVIDAVECSKLIHRHASNDWGDLGEHDRLLNDSAVLNGDGRIFSCYPVPGNRIYVITEDDRSRTTVLKSDEY